MTGILIVTIDNICDLSLQVTDTFVFLISIWALVDAFHIIICILLYLDMIELISAASKE